MGGVKSKGKLCAKDTTVCTDLAPPPKSLGEEAVDTAVDFIPVAGTVNRFAKGEITAGFINLGCDALTLVTLGGSKIFTMSARGAAGGARLTAAAARAGAGGAKVTSAAIHTGQVGVHVLAKGGKAGRGGAKLVEAAGKVAAIGAAKATLNKSISLGHDWGNRFKNDMEQFMKEIQKKLKDDMVVVICVERNGHVHAESRGVSVFTIAGAQAATVMDDGWAQNNQQPFYECKREEAPWSPHASNISANVVMTSMAMEVCAVLRSPPPNRFPGGLFGFMRKNTLLDPTAFEMGGIGFMVAMI